MLRSRLCQNQLNQEECEGGVEKGTEIKPCNTDPCPGEFICYICEAKLLLAAMFKEEVSLL